MALVVFLRGVNVGGHRRFRPSLLAQELRDHDVVNVGATGTFVVRKPGSRTKFRSELLRRLPFDATAILCEGRDLLRLDRENPFASERSRPDTVHFVSILARAVRLSRALPIDIPSVGPWFVRVIAVDGRFVFGAYRRHMKTIGYLGQLDRLLGATATTRGWNTIRAVARILRAGQRTSDRSSSRTPALAARKSL